MTTMTRRLIDYPPHRPFTMGQILGRLGTTVQNMVQASLEPRPEPSITQHCDRYGNAYWHIYDSQTGRNVYCMSEAEVSRWLDRAVFKV